MYYVLQSKQKGPEGDAVRTGSDVDGQFVKVNMRVTFTDRPTN